MSRSTGDHRRTSKLFLLFRMEGDRYALDAREVVEVLPLLRLKRIPEAPEWVAGVFSHRGVLVPVLDLCAMAFGRAALARTSTRIVLVEYRARQTGSRSGSTDPRTGHRYPALRTVGVPRLWPGQRRGPLSRSGL